jgi:SAM-dependent methyltransferase
MPKEVWDKVWNTTNVTSDYSLKYLDFMRGIIHILPRDAIVLEAGCGSGQTLRLFPPDNTTIGLDISPRALVITRNNCSAAILGDIFSIPLKDGSCDLVYNSGVIEHFRDPMNARAVREMARVTKKGGYVIVIVPNTLCLWYRLGKFAAVALKSFKFGYEEDYSLSRLRSVIMACNLTVVTGFGLQALPPLATNNTELLPVRVRKTIGSIERIFPGKQYYAYAVGIVARKL